MEFHYTVDLAPIIEVTGAEMRVSDEFELEPLTIGDETFTFTKPVRFDVTLTNTAAGVVAFGTVSAVVTTGCSRCLEEFEMPLVGEVEAFFMSPEHAADMPEEQEVEPIRDDKVDIGPTVLASLVVEAPFAPLCADECKGICPTCGTNLNTGACDCPPEEVESPFAKLKDLFPEQGEEE